MSYWETLKTFFLIPKRNKKIDLYDKCYKMRSKDILKLEAGKNHPHILRWHLDGVYTV
ncbi:hypothetical protein NEPTK9_000492 [Candidatus Neptunochlamydia vexilliferae]|uniref:Uncharacterized protein n=1 Tax=Candidatus Neptunichlamydia vexilliferae TaxID=1651774 RepID=A0ABS0AYE5_9BACT|nr:hypothetical protein [Candidatus Neptunochlamydia vexilliferae]